MTMETALRTRIKSGVSALTGQVDWTVRPQGAALPCIVLSSVSDARSQHMGGFNGYRPTRVQVDCYAATKAASVELREAAIAAVVPEGTVGGVSFLRAFINNVLDRGEQTDTGFVHRELIDLTIWHDA